MKGRIIIDKEFCKGCKFCIEFCPKGTIHLSDDFNTKGYYYAEFSDGMECSGCAICAIMCPEAAVEVYRE
ncbi:MAG: ferredoxin family protein [Spirochaetota bacterium]|nr:ferredoxin family protein [Spirochaetota bacterium]